MGETRTVVDRVGRAHLVDAADFRQRPLCGYFGITTPAEDSAESAGYACTECTARLEGRLDEVRPRQQGPGLPL